MHAGQQVPEGNEPNARGERLPVVMVIDIASWSQYEEQMTPHRSRATHCIMICSCWEQAGTPRGHGAFIIHIVEISGRDRKGKSHPFSKSDGLWQSQERRHTQGFYFVEVVVEGQFFLQGFVWFQSLNDIWSRDPASLIRFPHVGRIEKRMEESSFVSSENVK